MEELITIQQLANYLKVDRFTVYRLVTQKRIPAFKVGGQWRFKQEMIDSWLMRNSNMSEERPPVSFIFSTLISDEFARSQSVTTTPIARTMKLAGLTGRRYRGTTISSNSSAKRLGLRAASRSCRTGSFSLAKTSTMIRCRTLLGLRRT